MANWEVHLDEKKAQEFVDNASGTQKALDEATGSLSSTANSLSSWFRTMKCHIKGKQVGGTQPRYGKTVKYKKGAYVGFVHPKNYAAIKDNYLHNTLLKSMRRG